MLKYDSSSEHLWQMTYTGIQKNRGFLILVIFKVNLLSVKIDSPSEYSGYILL